MRYLTIILLTLFLNIACLGNKANKNLVTEGGTLSLDLIKSKESIDSLSKELAILKNDYINLQKEVDTNQNVVLEYGSSLVGIIVGIIILFGIVYYNSSKQAARDAFNDQFDNYSSSIKNKLTEAQLALDRVKTRIDVIDEAESEIEESTNRIEHEFQ